MTERFPARTLRGLYAVTPDEPDTGRLLAGADTRFDRARACIRDVDPPRRAADVVRHGRHRRSALRDPGPRRPMVAVGRHGSLQPMDEDDRDDHRRCDEGQAHDT